MAEYTLTTVTTVDEGANVPFNDTIVNGGCSIRHREGSGIIRLKGGTCCKPALYTVYFGANVFGTQGLIQLAIFLDGEQIPESVMSVTASGTTAVNSVSSMTQIPVYEGSSSISVRVITGGDITFNTANIIVKKEV